MQTVSEHPTQAQINHSGLQEHERTLDTGSALADSRAVERIVAGDEDALAELYERYANLVHSMAQRILVMRSSPRSASATCSSACGARRPTTTRSALA